ncbi:MAG: fumarylacetoacetate hydrolase family protein [Acidobacteria bacterium]|nr:fumarylacetoacetate hydrolase family protein [Acidobacteriota bacterium]
MKFVRFGLDPQTPATATDAVTGVRWGLVEGDQYRQVTGNPFSQWIATSRFYSPGQVRLLPPCSPSKIVCIGRNYAGHAKELSNPVPAEPLLFLKPPSSLIASGDVILYPPQSERVDYEGELGIVMGRRCSQVTDPAEALAYAFGYTCVNDVTARDLQKRDVQFTRGKGFDTFCAVGPCLAPREEFDASQVWVRTWLDGELKQDGNTRDLIFPLGVIISYVSQVMTLEPGDLIATGTPAGVGPMQPGSTVTVAIEGIGELRNPIRRRK